MTDASIASDTYSEPPRPPKPCEDCCHVTYCMDEHYCGLVDMDINLEYGTCDVWRSAKDGAPDD